MRRLLAVALMCVALPVLAQKETPPGLQPLPEPPPPPEVQPDNSLEPQVTIVKHGKETVEEYRINGRLYMMKVTPAHGKPYYLVDEKGNGQFTRLGSLQNAVSPPMWVIHEF